MICLAPNKHAPVLSGALGTALLVLIVARPPRQQRSATRATAAGRIRRSIWPAMLGCYPGPASAVASSVGTTRGSDYNLR